MRKKKTGKLVPIFPTSIRFPEELLDFLKKEAEERFTTVTGVVIEMVLQFKTFKEKVPKK